MYFKNKFLSLETPRVMGILNITPDSFSDGGRFVKAEAAIRQAEQMITEGAELIDIGGESTRPGAAEVSEQQELERVIPVIEAISQRLDTVISVDTSKAVVMTEAVNAGAGLINDVRALQEPGALAAAAESGAALCLMHMQGQPRTMQHNPEYHDVTLDVMAFLKARAELCIEQGIVEQRLILDPGFGFGKSLAHNYQLLNELDKLHQLQLPLLVGMSRKSMLGNLLNREVDERLAGSVAVATIAAMKGAQIIRVHDVQETHDALKVVKALHEQIKE